MAQKIFKSGPKWAKSGPKVGQALKNLWREICVYTYFGGFGPKKWAIGPLGGPAKSLVRVRLAQKPTFSLKNSLRVRSNIYKKFLGKFLGFWAKATFRQELGGSEQDLRTRYAGLRQKRPSDASDCLLTDF